jgi:hypothetical protein
MLKRRDTGLNSRRVSAGAVGASSEATLRCCVVASPGLQQEVNLLQTNVLPAVKALAKAYGVDVRLRCVLYGLNLNGFPCLPTVPSERAQLWTQRSCAAACRLLGAR